VHARRGALERDAGRDVNDFPLPLGLHVGEDSLCTKPGAFHIDGHYPVPLRDLQFAPGLSWAKGSKQRRIIDRMSILP